MTVEKAQAIIAQYGVILQRSNPPAVFQSKRSLPCSIARLKFAIYRYITELQRKNEFSPEQMENMIAAYSYLSFFIDDDKVNILNAIMLQKDDTNRSANRLKNEYRDVIHSITLQKETLIREIKEFILESREYVQN